ncbi:MAG: endonuclease [Candidatus Atribacteria bacterium]|nr:endonuclease [Candidatus Atribacteria bacterium]
MESKRAIEILNRLEEKFPDARILLEFKNPFELLVATVLAAQAPDERVNRVTKTLFSKFPTPEALSQAELTTIEEVVKPINYFRQKARFIKQISQVLVDRFAGKVPSDLNDLVALPGVGRKTANVVLANAFCLPAIPVDTHLARVANRLGLSQSTNPDKIEQEVAACFPREKWIRASHLLGFLGRFICQAKKPRCGQCPVKDLCPYPQKSEQSLF